MPICYYLPVYLSEISESCQAIAGFAEHRREADLYSY